MTQITKTKEAKEILTYLESISGKQTILGIHNREPNAIPHMQTQEILRVTGKEPAFWSGDFLFLKEDVENRWKMVEECRKQWESGAIVHLMLHVVPPTQTEPGVWEKGVQSRLTDQEWDSLLEDQGILNQKWKSRLDHYAVYLSYLKEHNVPVLFRPFHEMNQAAFWWAGRKGEKGTAQLYRMTREYLEKEKGLNNLIWIWNIQDLDYSWEEYNPGKEYWDIFSLDVYEKDRYTTKKYEKMLQIAGDAPIAIGECDVLPDAAALRSQPRWVFCMSWAELTFEMNNAEAIRQLYHAPQVITKEKLPEMK